ncbi:MULTISPECIES: hypothetical protein [unclassified Rhizobium]|uniref:hypothetical protein n=1 Tax=unclassified Rhizobium TaxID=2613769 RepID=UPI001491AFEB|nr:MULTISPECIES: hypothetical protein [unclassified Rhizobium]NNU66776.1 hypothetical protein [Rhizobium sp. WYCCWR 11152]NYT34589.1 hypothetical protein [Rhizobium sp. WYCCWR 11128]
MKNEREKGQWETDDAVTFMYGKYNGALLLALRDFWKTLRSAWPDKQKPPISPHRGDQPQE